MPKDASPSKAGHAIVLKPHERVANRSGPTREDGGVAGARVRGVTETNRDWWPGQLDRTVVDQHTRPPDPMGPITCRQDGQDAVHSVLVEETLANEVRTGHSVALLLANVAEHTQDQFRVRRPGTRARRHAHWPLWPRPLRPREHRADGQFGSRVGRGWPSGPAVRWRGGTHECGRCCKGRQYRSIPITSGGRGPLLGSDDRQKRTHSPIIDTVRPGSRCSQKHTGTAQRASLRRAEHWSHRHGP
jgi:hypothetical protein